MKRYLLDLSAIYSDHRQKSYLGHRASWSTVRSVIRTVQETFDIAAELYICSQEGILFPETESVEILRDDDTLKYGKRESSVWSKINCPIFAESYPNRLRDW